MFSIIKKLVFIILLFSTLAYSEEQKIAYIDVNKILSNSIPGKELLKQLADLEKTQIDKLSSKRSILNDEKNSILSKKNIISKDEFENNIKKFNDKLIKFKKEETKVVSNLKIKRNNSVIKFLNKINPLLEKYMNEKLISILIEKKNIFIAKSNYDITDELINLININIEN